MTQYSSFSSRCTGQVNALGGTCFPFSAHFGHTHAYADWEDKWVLAALRESRCEMTCERKGERWRKTSIVEITRMASCGANNHLIRHNISSHHINSKIAIVRERYICIYIFFSFSETVTVLFATIQLLRIYRRHKLRAPFIWSSKTDIGDLSGALYVK